MTQRRRRNQKEKTMIMQFQLQSQLPLAMVWVTRIFYATKFQFFTLFICVVRHGGNRQIIVWLSLFGKNWIYIRCIWPISCHFDPVEIIKGFIGGRIVRTGQDMRYQIWVMLFSYVDN